MDIRDLAAGDLDSLLDSRRRAFGPVPDSELGGWFERMTRALSEGRGLGVFDGPRLVATTVVLDLTQWWHGRPMSMGGISAVTVAPEDRGRGVGRRVVRAAIERCADLGHPVAALYPATTRIYRSLGWEHAGARHFVTLPPEHLRSIRQTERVKLRRFGPDDAPEVMEILGRVHAANRAGGPIRWNEHTFRIRLRDPDEFRYLADDGYVVYRWRGPHIHVTNLVAGSEATARALWAMVGTSSSIAESVRACVAPDDPMLWLIPERTADQVTQSRWMLRLVDVPAALAGRGYPLGVTLDTVIEVTDPERPANSGRWRLRISEGAATVERGAGGGSGERDASVVGAATGERPGSGAGAVTGERAGEVERVGSGVGAAAGERAGSGEGVVTLGRGGESTSLSVGGLSALFAGVPTATLRRTGLISGGCPAVDDALDTAFRGTPYMLDDF